MHVSGADIISRLQKDILSLQGFRRLPADKNVYTGLGPIEDAFPEKCFPLAAVHEFITDGRHSGGATNGFIACLAGAIMKRGGAAVWISMTRTVFPPALKAFGIKPDKIIFIDLKKEKEALWVMEEALKCEGLATVIGEIPGLNFMQSRRLQLAVEKSRVTGFIIRHSPRQLSANACVSRWKISSLPSNQEDNLPGIGFPRWNIELLKIRNGKPGAWQMEWSPGGLQPVTPLIEEIAEEQQRKVS